MDSFAFVKPKNRKRNSQGKLFTEDLKYAEADKYSEVGGIARSEASFNKFDAVESIVGFFGADEKKESNYKEGSEVTNYDKDIFSDEEEFEDNELEDSDNESMRRLKIERLLKDQSDLEEKKHQEKLEESIEVNFVDNQISFKRNNTYELYQKCVNSLVERIPEARDTFFEAKTNAEWENNKMSKLKKKLSKLTKMHEEFLKIGERKLILSIEKGNRKRIPGLSGSTQVYTSLRPPVIRETQTLEEIIDYPDLFDKSSNLCNENMELTLEDEAADSNVIRSDFDISEMELDNTELDDEVASTASDTKAKADHETLTPKSQREDSPEQETAVDSKHNIQTVSTKPEEVDEEDDNLLTAATRDDHMDLTAMDIPQKAIEEDEESTTSDLEFFVNEEVRRLQKIHKIPNEFFRFLFSNDEPELQAGEDVEAENHEEEAISTLGKDQDVEDEMEDEEETLGEDQDVEDEMEDEEETLGEDQDVEDEMGDEEETVEDEQEDLEVVKHHREDKDMEDQDENRGSTSPHDRGDSSSTTGSVLSEIQNTLPAEVSLASPPGFQASRGPGEDLRRRMILPCVGIPREKLPYVRIVMVPTIDIIKAYTKLDEEVYRLTHAPDGTSLGNSEEILARLMQQAVEIETAASP